MPQSMRCSDSYANLPGYVAFQPLPQNGDALASNTRASPPLAHPLIQEPLEPHERLPYPRNPPKLPRRVVHRAVLQCKQLRQLPLVQLRNSLLHVLTQDEIQERPQLLVIIRRVDPLLTRDTRYQFCAASFARPSASGRNHLSSSTEQEASRRRSDAAVLSTGRSRRAPHASVVRQVRLAGANSLVDSRPSGFARCHPLTYLVAPLGAPL